MKIRGIIVISVRRHKHGETLDFVPKTVNKKILKVATVASGRISFGNMHNSVVQYMPLFKFRVKLRGMESRLKRMLLYRPNLSRPPLQLHITAKYEN